MPKFRYNWIHGRAVENILILWYYYCILVYYGVMSLGKDKLPFYVMVMLESMLNGSV